MQATTTLLRTVAALIGVVFGLLALAIPFAGVLALRIEPSQGNENRMGHWLLGWGAFGLTILTGVVFCALVSAVLLRYARRGGVSRSFFRG